MVILPEKRPGQKFFIYGYEQPEYFPLFKEPDYTAVMDGEITYNQNSWVHITFVCAWGGTDNVSLKSFLEPPPKKVYYIEILDISLFFFFELLKSLIDPRKFGCICNFKL